MRVRCSASVHSDTTRGNMLRKCFFLLLFGCSLVRCQSGIPCNVTQTPNGTLYLLSNISACDLIYSWDNTFTVLSTIKKKMDGVVLDSSFKSLLTIPCYEEVKYHCFCKSENEPTTATCKTSCPVSSPRNGETSPNHIVVPPIVVSLLLIVAVVYLVYRKIRGDKSEVLAPENVNLDV